MNSKRIAFGIGIVLAVLAVFTASAAADNIIRLEPSDSGCEPDDEVEVMVYLNATDDVYGFQFHLQYEDSVVDIVNLTSAVEGTNNNWFMWERYWMVDSQDGHHYLLVTATNWDAYSFTGDNVELAKITLKGLSPGGISLRWWETHHTHPTEIVDDYGDKFPVILVDGTFTCTGPSETFTTSLDLGWNLISLPLTPEDASTSAVLGNDTIAYDHVYKYTSNQFVDVTTGTMEAGVGYFVNVTTAGTWSYSGYANEEMSVPLSQGLNCVGWTNTSADIPGGALDSIAGDYRYVARWNTAEQKYELYDAMAPPGVPEFIDFTTMERGVGYFIATKNGCTLTYP